MCPYPSRVRCRRYAMTVPVVDASVLAVAFADDGVDGHAARARLRGQELVAPELLDLEVVSVLRGQMSAGSLEAGRAELALKRSLSDAAQASTASTAVATMLGTA